MVSCLIFRSLSHFEFSIVYIVRECAAAAAAAKLLQSCPTLCDPVDGRQPSRLLRPWDSPGKSTEVGCHCLL